MTISITIKCDTQLNNFMLNSVYAECYNQAHSAEYRYSQCYGVIQKFFKFYTEMRS